MQDPTALLPEQTRLRMLELERLQWERAARRRPSTRRRRARESMGHGLVRLGRALLELGTRLHAGTPGPGVPPLTRRARSQRRMA